MALRATTAARKARIIGDILRDWRCFPAGSFQQRAECRNSAAHLEPGRPDNLRLVDPREVGRRGLGSAAGRACFLHAIMHIEYNAINLALDIAWRFPDMPERFYREWIEVAADEARHFALLESRLERLGYRYGDFPAHNGLWEIARKTAHDLLSRLAMVPCVMEARGLDVTPGMISRLEAVGDRESAALLEQILLEEERHVAVGIGWYRQVCAIRGLDPRVAFFDLLDEYLPGRIQGRSEHRNAPRRRL